MGLILFLINIFWYEEHKLFKYTDFTIFIKIHKKKRISQVLELWKSFSKRKLIFQFFPSRFRIWGPLNFLFHIEFLTLFQSLFLFIYFPHAVFPFYLFSTFWQSYNENSGIYIYTTPDISTPSVINIRVAISMEIFYIKIMIPRKGKKIETSPLSLFCNFLPLSDIDMIRGCSFYLKSFVLLEKKNPFFKKILIKIFY